MGPGLNVLVIGGTGFMGPRVVRALVQSGHAVTVFHRGETPCELPDETGHILGDRDDLPLFTDAIDALAPDVVVHMILGTTQDAWTARQVFDGRVPRCVLVSSMDVYRAYGCLRRVEPAAQQDVLDPIPIAAEGGRLRTVLFPYRDDEELLAAVPDERVQRVKDYDKIPIEELLLASNDMQVTVLRLPMVHGPDDGQHRLFHILKRMDDERPAILLDERQATWRTSRGYVEDVGHAIATAATTQFDGHRVFNIGDPEAWTEVAWIERIAERVGWAGQVVAVPDERLPESLRSKYDFRHHLWCETHSTFAALGLPEPTPIAEQLDATIDWERANPPAQIKESDFDYRAEDVVLGQL